MNDFREYSAAFSHHNSDLMHYGVKNMRWRKRTRPVTPEDEEDEKYVDGTTYTNLYKRRKKKIEKSKWYNRSGSGHRG